MKLKYSIYTLIIALMAQGAWATVFDRNGMIVSSTGETTTQQKQHAIDEGMRLAYRELLTEILVNATPADINTLATQKNSQQALKMYSIQKETISADTYTAVVNYSFNPSSVVDLAAQENKIVLTEQGDPILLVLLTQENQDNGRKQWVQMPDTTPMAQAFLRLQKNTLLRPITIATAPIKNPEEVTRYTTSVMEALRKEYAIKTVFVVMVDSHKIALIGRNVGKVIPIEDSTLAQPNSLLAMTLYDAMIAQWKTHNAHLSNKNRITAHIAVKKPTQWHSIETKMNAIPAIKNLVVHTARRNMLIFSMEYIGTRQNLGDTLGTQGFIIEEDNGADITLRCTTCN